MSIQGIANYISAGVFQATAIAGNLATSVYSVAGRHFATVVEGLEALMPLAILGGLSLYAWSQSDEKEVVPSAPEPALLAGRLAGLAYLFIKLFSSPPQHVPRPVMPDDPGAGA